MWSGPHWVTKIIEYLNRNKEIQMKTVYRLLVNGIIQTEYSKRNPSLDLTFTDRVLGDFESEEKAIAFYKEVVIIGYQLYDEKILKIQI